jgi:serine/threonine protein phosphatase 1
VDRGPDSRFVLDRLIERGRAHEVVCLKGNHELFLLDFFRSPEILRHWRQYGGLDTLMSYNVVPSTQRQNSSPRLRPRSIKPCPKSILNF